MKIHLSQKTTRTLVPIQIRIEEPSSSLRVVVTPTGEKAVAQDSFSIPMKKTGEGWQGSFWLEQPGDYELTAFSQTQKASEHFHVKEQVFLSFPVEFGIFLLSLVIVSGFLGGGFILWKRKKSKDAV